MLDGFSPSRSFGFLQWDEPEENGDIWATCLTMRIQGVLAEREGFEPPVPLRVRLISSQVHSTGLCQLSAL